MMKEPPPAFDALTASLAGVAGAVILTDRAGNVGWVNEAFMQLTGYARQEAIDGAPALRPFGEHTGRSCASFWRSVLSCRTWEGEVRGRDKDGNDYPVHLAVIPLCDRTGRTTHLLVLHKPVREDEWGSDDLLALEDAVHSWQLDTEQRAAQPVPTPPRASP